MMKVLPRFENASLAGFKLLSPEHERLKAVISRGIADGFKQNIIISGNFGTGKTFLAYAILNAKCEISQYKFGRYYRTGSFLYVTMPELLGKIKASFKSGEPKEIDEEKNAPVLIIDETGTQYGTDCERLELFEIIDWRYNLMLPTICLTNLQRDGLEDVLGMRICDRLFSGANYFELNTASMR